MTLMTRNKAVRREIFSVAEANATLPLVRAIVSDLSTLARERDRSTATAFTASLRAQPQRWRPVPAGASSGARRVGEGRAGACGSTLRNFARWGSSPSTIPRASSAFHQCLTRAGYVFVGSWASRRCRIGTNWTPATASVSRCRPMRLGPRRRRSPRPKSGHGEARRRLRRTTIRAGWSRQEGCVSLPACKSATKP